jgi:hypothetical protein
MQKTPTRTVAVVVHSCWSVFKKVALPYLHDLAIFIAVSCLSPVSIHTWMLASSSFSIVSGTLCRNAI